MSEEKFTNLGSWQFRSLKYDDKGGNVIIDGVPQAADLRIVEIKSGHEDVADFDGTPRAVANAWATVTFSDGRVGLWGNDEMAETHDAAIREIYAGRYARGCEIEDADEDTGADAAPTDIEERLGEMEERIVALEIERDARDTEAMERSERNE